MRTNEELADLSIPRIPRSALFVPPALLEGEDVYLVLGGTGTLDVSVGGRHTQTIHIGGVPRLYTLLQAGSARTGTILLHASAGVQAYDFTFG